MFAVSRAVRPCRAQSRSGILRSGSVILRIVRLATVHLHSPRERVARRADCRSRSRWTTSCASSRRQGTRRIRVDTGENGWAPRVEAPAAGTVTVHAQGGAAMNVPEVLGHSRANLTARVLLL